MSQDVINVYGHRGQTIPVSVTTISPEVSALMCPCGKTATPAEEYQATREHAYLCSQCDNAVMIGRKCGIRSDAIPLFDPNKTREAYWYHATTTSNWHQKVSNSSPLPLVHVGTREAALSRIVIMERSPYSQRKNWFLYKVSLSPDAKIAPVVMDDLSGDAPETVQQAQDDPFFESAGATRYLNRYEQVGSVSLLANPHYLDVSMVGNVDLDALIGKGGTPKRTIAYKTSNQEISELNKSMVV